MPRLLAVHFQNRIARVIAGLRLVLAFIFLIALYAEPSQPVRSPVLGYAILAAYLVVAAMLLRVAWSSWWYDHRLAWPAFLIDMSVFAFSVWLTENGDGGFNSPFMAFFFFLMFSASLRWNWRATAVAALIAVCAYLLAGGILVLAGSLLDMQVFVRRLTYLTVIAVAFVFAAIQSLPQATQSEPRDAGEFDALEAAVRHAAARLGAGRIALLWEDRDEPPVLTVWNAGAIESRTIEPLAIEDSGCVRLFDLRKGRVLCKAADRDRVVAETAMPGEAIARLAQIEEGLSIGLGTEQGARGVLLAGAMAGFTVDDLDRFRLLAADVVAIVTQRTLAEVDRARAVVQTREALARDLHDSVAQALAGASFGLEAIRQTLPPDAGDAQRLTGELKATIRREQAAIREMIDRLRIAPDDRHHVVIGPEIARTAQECALRWNIGIAVDAHGTREVAAPLAFECKQIVREAVANAVRHGKAGHVSIVLTARPTRLQLEIENDGEPFGEGPERSRPWTICERVIRLGGEIDVSKASEAAKLTIQLPLAQGLAA